MENFAAKQTNKGKRTRYAYYPGEEGRMIKISISFRDGGQNHFHGSQEKRGIEVGISEVTLERQPSGIVMEGFSPFDDVNGRLLVLELPRYSPKKIESVARTFDAVAPEISRLWAQDRAAGHALLLSTAEAAAKAA